MTDDVMHSALTAWATKDLPARLIAAQVAKLLNCTTDDVALLVSAGKLPHLGQASTERGEVFQHRRTYLRSAHNDPRLQLPNH